MDAFRILIGHRTTDPINFNKQQLILYLTTQSNIISAVESGTITYTDAEAWLDNELTPFFAGATNRNIIYGNWIKYLHKL